MKSSDLIVVSTFRSAPDAHIAQGILDEAGIESVIRSKNLCALVFLVLAFSPLTAPFQTYHAVPTAVAAPLDAEHDPGSLVAPLVTKSAT